MIDLPFCQVLMLEEWDAVPGRFFVACRTAGNFTKLLGQGVVDEFRTISGPILLSPADTIGGIYDAGMRLADARDLEAPIDQGWPPLTIGIDVAAPERPDDWLEHLLIALKTEQSTGAAPWSNEYSSASAGEYQIETVRCSITADIVACIVVTNAPMLPPQLERLAEVGDAPITVAVSVGNRLPRVSAGELQQVDVISEAQLDAVLRILKPV
jgi:hypothetical protein